MSAQHYNARARNYTKQPVYTANKFRINTIAVHRSLYCQCHGRIVPCLTKRVLLHTAKQSITHLQMTSRIL